MNNSIMPAYCVCVLRSRKDGLFYLGYTTNIVRRFAEHAEGKSASTAPRRPFDLLYCEHHTDKYDALRRERYFKTSVGKRMLKLILADALKRTLPI